MSKDGLKAKSMVRDGMKIDIDVPIPMDDGLVLRADVYRPVEDGRYPALISYGPYAKGLSFQEAYKPQWDKMVAEHPDVLAGSTNKYQTWEAVDPEKWVPDGYVCVRVDSRGAGQSPGVLDVWSPRETLDFYHCIEWAAAQPWSNGRVGLAGISYYAMNQYQVAALEPPHLTAMCPWEGASDFYREMGRHGGILSTFTLGWFPRQVSTVQYGLGTRAAKSFTTGESVAGPETLSDEELKRNRVEFGKEIKKHALDGPVVSRFQSGLVKGEDADAHGRQLGRTRLASARKRRGVRPGRLRAEMARGARPRALDPLLHRLRNQASEAILRSLPEGRRQRLGQVAARPLEHTPRQFDLRRAFRERMAARPNPVDEILPRPQRARRSARPRSRPSRNIHTTRSATASPSPCLRSPRRPRSRAQRWRASSSRRRRATPISSSSCVSSIPRGRR